MTSLQPARDQRASHPRRLLVARALRERHNDFDYECRYWIGDRRPDPTDARNRDFGGEATALRDRRCLVCRPRSRTEADDLLNARLGGQT